MEKSAEAALTSDMERDFGVPVLARQRKIWHGICVDWERVGPCQIEPHGHDEHGIHMMLSRCSHLVLKEDGRSRDGSAEIGDLAIIPAGQAIGYSWDAQIEVLSLSLTPAYLDEIAARTFDFNGHRVELIAQAKIRDPLITAIAATLRRELEEESAGSRLLVDSLTQALAVHLLRAHSSFPTEMSKTNGGLPRWRLQRATAFIEEHLSADISLPELAEAAGNLSLYHFARLFKESTGSSPYQYLLRRRIERAKSMLRGRKLLSLGDVAFACGFRDQSAFSRVFRQITGSTPRAYRDA